ncbi:MAG: hypothetical protein IT160_19550 [Bryobacterales bacterium]|nr:hypothetical protein [Bryobacterales bacterium]
MADDGLAGPLPARQPRPVEREPDLEPGTVDGSIAGTLRTQAQGLGQYMGAVGSSAAQSKLPHYKEFTPDRDNALGEVETVFDKAVGHDESTLGAFKAVGGAMHTGLMRPIAAITDAYQASQIRDLQDKFLASQAGRLSNMDLYETNAKKAMRKLSNMLSSNWPSGIDTGPVRKLMEEKASAGNDVAAGIADALAQSSDPEERSQLEALQGDFQKWIGERNQRVSREQGEVRALVDRTDGLNAEILRQIPAMEDAGTSIGPRNEVASNGAITGTSHADIGAISHAKSLRDFLIGSRGRVSRVLGGPQ